VGSRLFRFAVARTPGCNSGSAAYASFIAMNLRHTAFILAALTVAATCAPATAQSVGGIRRSLDKATGGQTASPTRPAPAAPAANPQQAAALQAAQNKRNQAAAVGADQRVIDFLKERVEGGSAEAAFDLAKRYEEGKGIKADPKEARRLYELAGQRGHEEAKAWLKEHPAPVPVSVPPPVPANRK
jgi:TPR repeat protein